MLIPTETTEDIKSLLEKIGTKGKPQYVKCVPIPEAPANHCFPLVDEKIKSDGGKCILGWQIWQTFNLLEAEFHCVWQGTKGKLLDIAPKTFPVEKILFVQDRNAIYEGKQVNNIRINISNNTLCDDFIEICDAIFRIENRGRRAFQYELQLPLREREAIQFLYETKSMLEVMMMKNEKRTSPCICESGKKYKTCHGKKIKKLIKKF